MMCKLQLYVTVEPLIPFPQEIGLSLKYAFVTKKAPSYWFDFKVSSALEIKLYFLAVLAVHEANLTSSNLVFCLKICVALDFLKSPLPHTLFFSLCGPWDFELNISLRISAEWEAIYLEIYRCKSNNYKNLNETHTDCCLQWVLGIYALSITDPDNQSTY